MKKRSNTFKKCMVADCDGNAGHYATAKGWCLAHYQRFKRHGDPMLGGAAHVAGGAICTVEGCQSKSSGKGLCAKHRNRFQKYGNVHVFQKPANEPSDWIKENASNSGDECLKWPFSVGNHGRGTCRLDGVAMTAPRAMCTVAHGPPPADHYEAAHSCGKGHEGCVNPRHLSWKTAVENEADKVAHGTWRKGTAINTSKLSERDVLTIKMSPTHRGTASALANRFGVSKSAIYAIRTQKAWSWLSGVAQHHRGE